MNDSTTATNNTTRRDSASSSRVSDTHPDVDDDEAALIDGASYFTIYWRIILPLLKPAIATVIIIKGVAIYNEFYIPFLYMPKKAVGVVSTPLFKFKGPYGTQWEIISAGIVIAIIPTLIIFLLLQKYIYNGLTQGSVK